MSQDARVLITGFTAEARKHDVVPSLPSGTPEDREGASGTWVPSSGHQPPPPPPGRQSIEVKHLSSGAGPVLVQVPGKSLFSSWSPERGILILGCALKPKENVF